MLGYGARRADRAAGRRGLPVPRELRGAGRDRGAAALRRAPARRRVGGAAQGRLDLPRAPDRQGDQPDRHAAGHGLDRRGHHRARRHADEVARLLREQEAILGTASVGIVFVQGPAHRALQPALRGDVRLRARASCDGKPTSLPYAEPSGLRAGGAAYDADARAASTARRVEPARRKDGSDVLGRAPTAARSTRRIRARGSVWTVEDITEQKRAEEELQRVLAEQQAMLDNVVVGIAFLRERKIVRCNRRFEEMFGFAPGEAIGASYAPDTTSPRRSSSRRGQVYAELDQGRTHAREQWLRRKDGSGFWCRRHRPRGRRRRSGARLRLAARGHQRAQARRRGARAPGARAGRGAAERGHRHHLRQGPAHRALQPPLRGDLRLRRRASCSTGSTRFMFASDADYEAGGEPLYEPVWRGETRVHRAAPRAQGRHAHLVLALRARGAARRPGEGLGLAVRRHHPGARGRGESTARAREQELILDNASVGIAFVRNRAIQRCNRFLEDMVGAGPGELIGKSTRDAVRRARANGRRPGGAAYSTHRARRHPRRRGALQARATAATFLCRTRGRRIDTGEADRNGSGATRT